MTEKIELVNIVRSEDFLRELNRAATMSHENKRESGFNVYTDEHFSQPCTNRAVLEGEHSASSDMVIGDKHEPKNGYYIPSQGYRLIHLHFHPPHSNLRPSRNDIKDCLDARTANVNLRDSSNEFEREVYEDEEETNSKDYEVDYINPVSMIGLVRDDPKNIELLVYQEITEEPVTIDKFYEFVANYCQKLYGRAYDLYIIEIFDFPIRFKSTKKVVEFLNASSYLQAVDVKIRNGELSEKDWGKLEKFQLIQTRFFPEEFDYSNEDDLT